MAVESGVIAVTDDSGLLIEPALLTQAEALQPDDADAVLARVIDEIPDDEEIAVIAHAMNDVELVVARAGAQAGLGDPLDRRLELPRALRARFVGFPAPVAR